MDLLDAALRALSLFNTIAFLWLGLAVLLNAERRVAGTWLTGGALVAAGLFFAGHLAVVSRPPESFQGEMPLWWGASRLLFVASPHAWYTVVAWYTGALRGGQHRTWFFLLAALGVAAVLLPVARDLVFARGPVAGLLPAPILVAGDVPVSTMAYPAYGALCIALTLAALRQPGPASRFMGEAARRRARPWLVAASLVLLAVTLVVGGLVGWLMRQIWFYGLDPFAPSTFRLLMTFDLAVSALLALAVVLLGRAIVAYEIFTGKALPRGGLLRHWRNSLILAAGFGTLMGGSLTLRVDPVYHVLLATLLVALFYALLTWRSFAERERSIERLRPFVASQRLYERLLAPSLPPEADVAGPFHALAAEVLGARVAYLVALGPLAPLVGPPLAHPPGVAPLALDASVLAGTLREAQPLGVPVDPRRFGGAGWAVPLWSERGLIGALLLGEKRGGGLYAQEEIEVARAAGERLLDARAGAEMARRLMALQRQRMAESRVLDARTRHALHDEVLPRLHAALLAISATPVGTPGRPSEAVETLVEVHRRLAALLREMPSAVAPEIGRLGLMGALRQTVESELKGAFDGVAWRLEPGAERTAAALPPLAAEVLFGAAREALRNAARHGRGPDAGRALHLAVALTCQEDLQLSVEDDGVGLEAGGPAGPESGHGLALHGTMMAVIGGALTAETTPAGATRVTLSLPREVPL